MTHKQFDDDQLENVLNNAPKPTDHRSKDEVLKRLLADARLQDNHHIQEAISDSKDSQEILQEASQQDISVQKEKTAMTKRKRKNSKMPIFISVAAVFVLSLIVGSMVFDKTKLSNDQASLDPSQFSVKQEDRAMKEDTNNIMESSILAEHTRMISLRTAVYEEDLTDATVFRIGLAGGAAESVPMTYIIPNERIIADFGEKKPSTLQMYEKYAPQIDEEAMGFVDYHPYKGKLKEQDESLVHVLPEKNEYDVASGTLNMYTGSLKDTFSEAEYRDVAFKNTDGTAYTFSQAGEPSEPMPLTQANHYNYYLYTETNGVEYLSPNFHQSYPNVIEALTLMRNKYNDIYVPVVPENVTYTVKEEADGVVVTFDTPLDLAAMDAVRATQLIEAMMLTAANFDKKLRLDNVVQESWEGFDLKNFLPMPVGANKQYMP